MDPFCNFAGIPNFLTAPGGGFEQDTLGETMLEQGENSSSQLVELAYPSSAIVENRSAGNDLDCSSGIRTRGGTKIPRFGKSEKYD